jgi:hypothetical protein
MGKQQEETLRAYACLPVDIPAVADAQQGDAAFRLRIDHPVAADAVPAQSTKIPLERLPFAGVVRE